MNIIVCDASPLVFLAKLDLLRLIPEVLNGQVHVLKCVADEVRSEKAGLVELARLDAFFNDATIVKSESSIHTSKTLSACDRFTLTWAVENQADWLVADERLLRRIAMEEGVQVVGFLGLIIEGVHLGWLSSAEAKAAIDTAISDHGCRISVHLYQRIVSALSTM